MQAKKPIEAATTTIQPMAVPPRLSIELLKQAKQLYLCILAWGKPEFESIDDVTKVLFRSFASSGGLAAHMRGLIHQILQAVPWIELMDDCPWAASRIDFGDDLTEIYLNAAAIELSSIMNAIAQLSVEACRDTVKEMTPIERKAANANVASSNLQPRIITATVAAFRYAVTKKTISLNVKNGALTDHRRPPHPGNAQLLVDEVEVAARWLKK